MSKHLCVAGLLFIFLLVETAAAQTALPPLPKVPEPEPVVNSSVTGVLLRYAQFPSSYVSAREVDVWIPPGYQEHRNRRYPVVYMQDGQNLFDAATAKDGKEWKIDETMTRFLETRKARAAIVIGIWSTPNRASEYVPLKPTSSATQGNKPADDYLKFMVNELKRFMDRNYRTRRARADTFVMGSDLGAVISLYAMTEYPRVFGRVACLSTDWGANEGGVVGYFRTHLPSRRNHRFYFDYGSEGIDEQNEPLQMKVDQIMEAAHYRRERNWQSLKFPGDARNEEFWAKRAAIPLTFLLHH